MINRGALIVRLAEPFVEWARGLDDTGIVPGVRGEHSVFLLPEWVDGYEAEHILEQVDATVFGIRAGSVAHRRIGLATGPFIAGLQAVVSYRDAFDGGGSLRR